jgi:hypothetical protein
MSDQQQHVAIFENGRLTACGILRPNSNRFSEIKAVHSGSDPTCANGTPDVYTEAPKGAKEQNQVYDTRTRGTIDHRSIETGAKWTP